MTVFRAGSDMGATYERAARRGSSGPPPRSRLGFGNPPQQASTIDAAAFEHKQSVPA
jgi:hypothetical protein